MSEWWLSRGDGKTEGPVSTQSLVDGLVSGQIPNQSQVCRVGEQAWTRISQIDEIWEAANPEQIRTNITERPWFLSSADSGRHALHAPIEPDDERTQLLTPLPIVTPPGIGSKMPFVTPLPRPATHRELFARQNHPAARNAAPATSNNAMPVTDAPMRPRVPTLEGISSESVALGPIDDRQSAPATNQVAGSSKSHVAKGVAPPVPHASHHTAPVAPKLSHRTAPLVPNAPHQAAPLATQTASSKAAAASPAIGIAPLAGIPSQGPHPTTKAPASLQLAGIASLQRAPAPLSTPSSAEADPSHGAKQDNSRSRLNLPTDALKRGLVVPSAVSSPPRNTSAARGELANEEPSFEHRGNALAPDVPARITVHAQSASNQLNSARPAQRPRLPAPGPLPPHERSSGHHSAPSLTREGLRPGEHPPAASHLPAPTPVPELSRSPAENAAGSTDHPSDADELTTIARTPSPRQRVLEEGSGEDEMTVVAHRASSATDASRKPVPAAERSTSESPPSFAGTADDDELTALISTGLQSHTGERQAHAPAALDDEATTIIKAPVVISPPTSIGGTTANPPLHRTSRIAAESSAKSAANAGAIVSLINAATPDAIVTDPTQLLEECCDDDSSEQKPPRAAVILQRPTDTTKTPSETIATMTAIAPPSAPPPARRPRFLSAPSIVLNPEPIVHQEATQPAARALRQGTGQKLQLGTVIISVLALTLAALAIAYIYLHRP